MDKIFSSIQNYALQMLSAAIITIIGYVCVKVILSFLKKLLNRTKMEHTAVTFILSVAKVILYVIIIIAVLSKLGINVDSIITAIGAAALTAGLALQSTLSNIASGVIILLSKPFVAGDILEFNGMKGTVKSIKIFTTTIHTFDNRMVTIPNSQLTSNDIVNCTMADTRRLDLTYTISYDDDIRKVKELLYHLIDTNNKIMKEPVPGVYVGEHLDSGIQIIIQIWVNPDDYYPVYYFMQENVKLLFDDNGITIPYPHIVLKKDN